MDCTDFLKTATAGGELLARQAWAACAAQIKAALPDRVAEIDAALAPNPAPEPELVEISASDVGNAADIVGRA